MSERADSREAISPSPLLAAGRLLAERGVYGLVWFGDDLVVAARYGRLTEFCEVGDPLTEHCIALIGLEAEIAALADTPGRVIDLPAVAIVTTERELPRLNMTIFWHSESAQFVMLVARATSRSDIEGELSKQMRARLMAEAEVVAKSRELARANRDLEDFAAIISHDLKAPLRALRFAAEDVSALLDGGDVGGARARLGEVAARTRRMSDMMTALLDYASVGRKADIAEMVDTGGVVAEVVRSCPVRPGFTLTTSGAWPKLRTVRAALDLVLRNLVDNALKHHDRDRGTIDIEATLADDALVIVVRDDGPGIAPEYHRTVLLPFRTLSPPRSAAPRDPPTGGAAAEGTGMGLAFVNRTVETIGGRLAIRSDPTLRRGTEFVLSWPLSITS